MAGGLPVQVRSAADSIRPFRWRIALTYVLTVVEDLLELSYPWATGLAINGLLAHDYRMAVPVMVAWMLHTAVGGARQMYDTHDFSPMPILADALQDAGCDNEAVLSHCRGPGPHARGCWVVDRVLG